MTEKRKIEPFEVVERKYEDKVYNRIMSRVGPEDDIGCRDWTGPISRLWGYGVTTLDNKSHNASRAVYKVYNNLDLGSKIVVCHKCDRPSCCNPEHLFHGTQGDNVRDCRNKNRNRGPLVCEYKNHPRFSAKVNPAKVRHIRTLWKLGMQQTKIAKIFDIHSSQVSRIVREEDWKHIK